MVVPNIFSFIFLFLLTTFMARINILCIIPVFLLRLIWSRVRFRPRFIYFLWFWFRSWTRTGSYIWSMLFFWKRNLCWHMVSFFLRTRIISLIMIFIIIIIFILILNFISLFIKSMCLFSRKFSLITILILNVLFFY